MTRRIAIALALIVITAVASGVVPLIGTPPAGACDCSTPTDAEAFDQSDAVFLATLDDVTRSRETARFEFTVDEVFKGEVTEIQVVLTPADGAACGFELSGPGPYVVFADRESSMVPETEKGALYSHLCSGTRALADGVFATDVEGTPPVPEITTPTRPSSSAGQGAVPATGSGEARPWIALGAGTAVFVAALAGWALLRRRSS